MNIKLNQLANAIRFLSIDAVQKANSGHPGMPMGMADVATVLFKYHLRFNPENPNWINRDRFILSAGHGSMLLYSLLYLTGYRSVLIDDIKNFRQLNSICAGHPEYIENSGIETTTGPLGQGLGNSVGMAIGEEIFKKKFGSDLINHKTYVIASDGDLMEGISHEAMSLAGHLKLRNLIVFFDNNKISIDGSTALSVSDNFKKRFEGYGWNFQEINGHNEKQISKAINKASKSKKPTIISCKTIIGYGSPNKSGKASSHGSPLGEEEINLVRKKLKWTSPPFTIPSQILEAWREIGKKGKSIEKKWNEVLNKKNPKIKSELESMINNSNLHNLEKIIKEEKTKYFTAKPDMATRQCSSSAIEVISKFLPELIGGSADLSGSNNTKTNNSKIISSKNFNGNYIHYGVREHGMAATMNGLALYGGLIPYGGTFLIFSDYCKPAIRLSALMGLRVIYIFSHDSIGLGEDGPTHQPIEHLSGLRAIPNLNVFRPADINETLECWEIALKSKNNPSALALSRQKLPYVNKQLSEKNKCNLGAYDLNITSHDYKLILIASGSEVEIALEAQKMLKQENIDTKVVSMPCQELFDIQDKNYQEKILETNSCSRIVIEAGSMKGWAKYVKDKGEYVGIENFGKSAPYKQIYDHFDINTEKVIQLARKLLKK
ncbi:MAG: transketolase [Pelagibacterales bacterium MED-G40]|nr:MAG: transketolase [Pelagibacterales bacterium MED-G40]